MIFSASHSYAIQQFSFSQLKHFFFVCLIFSIAALTGCGWLDDDDDDDESTTPPVTSPSTNANLASLALTAGVLSPGFASATTDYTVSVPNSINSIILTATPEDSGASADVDSSGDNEATIALSEGDNNVGIVVTAEDGASTKSYTVIVTRAAPSSGASTNASLSDLVLSGGSLDQMFQATSTSYTASVAFTVTSTTVTPTTDDMNATVTVNGVAVESGAASGAIGLAEGFNPPITVVVTAEDGTTTKTYTVEITRESAAIFGQQAFLKASNAGAGDNFGNAVALSGDTLVVGATDEKSSLAGGEGDDSATDAGAAYVFIRGGGVWTQQAFLKASNAEAGDIFGSAVAIDGDTLVVSARRESSNGTGGETDNSTNDAGAVYVYTRTAGVWTQEAYLKASNPGASDNFGWSVALSGDTLAVGAQFEDGNSVNGEADNSAGNAGAVYVFTRAAGVWTQQSYLKSQTAAAGDQFGSSVALLGDTLAVGSNGDDDSVQNSGAAYVFTRAGGIWTQQAFLKASNPGEPDQFGITIALTEDTLAVGAPWEDSSATGGEADESATQAGAVYVYTNSSGTWTQQAYLKASNAGTADHFGWAVALTGDTLLIGARDEDSSAVGGEADNSATNAGAAYVFTRSGNTWTQQKLLKAANAESNDFFGDSVAISGGTMAIGASGESSSAAGGQADNTATGAGAVYVFE